MQALSLQGFIQFIVGTHNDVSDIYLQRFLRLYRYIMSQNKLMSERKLNRLQ